VSEQMRRLTGSRRVASLGRAAEGVRPYTIICKMILYDEARALFASSRS